MNKAKAMLDALMGPSRDISKKDKPNDEFKDKNVCKYYLVGCCPDAILGKKLEAIRQSPASYNISPGVIFDKASVLNPKGCEKLHSQGLRTQFAEHPDHAKYRRQYEEDLLKFIREIIIEAESKASHEKRKREALGNTPDTEKLCDVCGLRYKLQRKEYGIEVQDHHDESEFHIAMAKMRKRLEDLSQKQKQWEAEDAKKEEDKKAKNENQKKDDEKKDKKEKSDDKPGDKKEKSGEGRDRSRSRDRGGGDRGRGSKGDRDGSKDCGQRSKRSGSRRGDRKDRDSGGGDRRGDRGDRGDQESSRGGDDRGRGSRGGGGGDDRGRGRRDDSRDRGRGKDERSGGHGDRDRRR